MKLRPVSLAVVALLSGLALQAAADEARHTYIVRLADAPAATYTGGVSGLPATRPAPGARLDVSASDVQAYLSYLDQQQASVAATVPAAQITHQYKLVLNGFAARLTDAEVRALKKHPGVAGISADEARTLDTNYTPTFLGLDQPGSGLWDKLGGKIAAGENIVIGIVDSGIWPENPAYADRTDAQGTPTFDPSGTPAYQPLPGWKGACQTGEGFTALHCNNKLIGARYFREGFEADGKVQHWTEFVSPRDSIAGAKGHGGHGTHTSTTAGGNNGVAANLSGINIGRLSGMAPRARLAAYKVCWTYVDEANPDGTGSRNSCYNSDSVAAIDQAVADGVDVINYSISGSQTSVTDPVELAFFDAAVAGVFVAASAGNSGPSNAVAHVSPWLTTVAASTHNRFNGATLTIGNGATYLGASYNETPLPGTPTILAQDAAMLPFTSLSAANKLAAARCYNATDRAANGATADAALDPAKASGKVLLCERGTSARTDKSKAVKDAGGAGMILIDVSATTAPIADPHSVPAVHLNVNDGAIVKAFIAANANSNSAIGKFTPQVGATPAPVMADFSSRGPNKHNANLLKPDLTAPGVDILAGFTPGKTQAERDAIANNIDVPEAVWSSLQGTSMSSPHVAGLAALLRQAHPTWSPAAIKSALMTTAGDTFNDNQPGMANGRLPWAQGAGHVAPSKAVDPGLVYDSGPVDWIRYMCGIPGTLPAGTCQGFGSIQPYNLNMASLTASAVLGKITLTRTVTNVSDQPGNYTAQANLPGYDVVVSPSALNLAPGAKGTFNVTLTRTTAAINAWAYGSLTWTDATHTVRSPLTARAASLAVPSLLTSEVASGNVSFTIGSGYTGLLGIKKGGLQPASRGANTIGLDNSGDGGVAACRAGGSAGVKVHSITVPSDSLLLRAALYDTDTSGYQAGGKDDLDLIVLNPAGTLVGSSGGSSSNEVVTLSVPAAGTYKACVVGFAPKGGSSNYTLSSWVVKNGDIGGNFKVNPPPAVIQGATATAAASWYGLAPAKHLAAMVYTVNNVNTAITVLEVDTTDPVPEPSAQRNDAPGRF